MAETGVMTGAVAGAVTGAVTGAVAWQGMFVSSCIDLYLHPIIMFYTYFACGGKMKG
jgi:hypothetical protein